MIMPEKQKKRILKLIEINFIVSLKNPLAKPKVYYLSYNNIIVYKKPEMYCIIITEEVYFIRNSLN